MNLSCKHVWGNLNESYWYQSNLLLKMGSVDQQLQQDMGAWYELRISNPPMSTKSISEGSFNMMIFVHTTSLGSQGL
jgi:hypothetical protein